MPEHEFDDSAEVVSELVYRDVNIKVIEVPDDNENHAIRVISHRPISNDYTVAVPKRIIDKLHENNTLGPFLFGIQGSMQLIINRDLAALN